MARTIRSGQQTRLRLGGMLIIVLDLILGMSILFGIPLMVGVLNGLPLQTGYKWDLLYIAFPDITLVVLGSGILLLVVAAGRATDAILGRAMPRIGLGRLAFVRRRTPEHGAGVRNNHEGSQTAME